MIDAETPSPSKVRQPHSQICCPAVLQSISQPLSHPWLFSDLNLVLIRHTLSHSLVHLALSFRLLACARSFHCYSPYFQHARISVVFSGKLSGRFQPRLWQCHSCLLCFRRQRYSSFFYRSISCFVSLLPPSSPHAKQKRKLCGLRSFPSLFTLRAERYLQACSCPHSSNHSQRISHLELLR